ncbi:MAG: hypothetical protein ACI8WB_000891 [Phenylobacterium sp.]
MNAGFNSELFQRWQFTPVFFKQLNDWAAKPWPVKSAEEERLETDKEWPAYLQCLQLPQQIIEDPTSVTPKTSAVSNYPDPYSVNMFWIQPLMFAAQLQETEITRIMSAVTSPAKQLSNNPSMANANDGS